MSLTLKIENGESEILARNTKEDNVCLVYKAAYNPGDAIVLEVEKANVYLFVQFEDSMTPAFIYMAGLSHKMLIPFFEKRVSYSPKSFAGEIHLLTARYAEEKEIAAYKNLALNPFDCHENKCLFPHSSANAETRGEAVFAARNAIDGIYANSGHGIWPYQSWGINLDPDAEMKIAFGRPVKTNKAVLVTRADFPHDSWWTEATLLFSDGSFVCFPLRKTAEPQAVEFASRECEWVVLKKLIKAGDESPFPALSQIEVWGTEA